MNWLDIAITIIFAVFLIIGLFRGFVRQVFSILAIGGGLIIATMFYDLIGNLLTANKFVINTSIANILGFVLVLVISYIIIFLIAVLLIIVLLIDTIFFCKYKKYI